MAKFRIALTGLALAALAGVPGLASAQSGYGYSHVTAVEGGASVLSDANGRVDARLNLPLSAGDELATYAGARLEIELADGNRLQLDGESRLRLDALAGETEDSPQESALTLLEGSLAAESVPLGEQRAFRIDTGDASVYMPGEARVRINANHHRGTDVIVRAGQIEVQARSGSNTVEAGQYLSVEGDAPAEIAEGTFSRDRFDIWVADRTASVLDAYNSGAARYTDEAYAGDTAVLDGYGQWDYSPTYETTVWRPTVDAGWSPYSDGYWYYTPVGATWVSYEPWGWFPFHYGNWFFDAAFSSWCWAPAYVYSPAWVYWGYTSSYVGWCPIGWYSYYSPYRGYWGFDSWRRGVYLSVGGVFDCRRVDFGRAWNFVGVGDFGRRFRRADVLPASSVRGRLGSTVAISSDPVRVSARSGAASTALRTFARNAPQVVAGRSSRSRSAELAPYLARQRELPAATVTALRQSAIARVDASRGRLEGPGAASLPARPGQVRSRVLAGGPTSGPPSAREPWRGRSAQREAAPGRPAAGGSRSGTPLRPGEARELGAHESAPRGDSWRVRETTPAAGSRPEGVTPRPPSSNRGGNLRSPTAEPSPNRTWRQRSAPTPPPPARGLSERRAPAGETWRGRPAETPSTPDRPAPRAEPGRSREAWRERVTSPPARRVIDGIDRGRAIAPPPRATESPQRRELGPAPRSYDRPAPRSYAAPTPRSYDRPAPRSYDRPTPRSYDRPTPRSYDRPAPRSYNRPTPRSYAAPAPRSYAAPTPRSYAAPAPRSYAAPAPRSYGRSAPAPPARMSRPAPQARPAPAPHRSSSPPRAPSSSQSRAHSSRGRQ